MQDHAGEYLYVTWVKSTKIVTFRYGYLNQYYIYLLLHVYLIYMKVVTDVDK